MRFKSLSIFVGMLLLVNLFAPSSAVRAWTVQPQKVTFVNAEGINLIGWLFKPDEYGPYPAVVMMPDCLDAYVSGDPTRGISSLYREWGDRFVNAGYVALVIDSFTPRNIMQNQCGNGTLEVSEVHDRPSDAYAGLNYLSSQAFVVANKIGLLGWSHGGSSTMAATDGTNAPTSSGFKAAVAFYPKCDLSDAFGGIRRSTWKPYAPFVILHGSIDTVANPTTCITRIIQAQKLGAENITINIFENAPYNLDGPRQVTDTFTEYGVDAKIAADAQVLHFFGLHLR